MSSRPRIVLDHVALVVGELEQALLRLSPLQVPAGETEEFPGEGTREVYLGGERQAGALLLMQPLGGTGPYARALERRGPGLHHLAIHVPALEQEIGRLAGSGWYLHPRSVETIGQSRTAWLARPGIGVLIELQESGSVREDPPLITAVEVPARSRRDGLFEALGLETVTFSDDQLGWISLNGTRLRADDWG